MKAILPCILCTLALTWGSSQVLAFEFSLLPGDGATSGPAGSTVGWGYSITNTDTQNWLVTTSLNAGTFQHGTSNAGLFDLPILAPGATTVVPYDGVRGLYDFTWDSSVPLGFSNSGQFILGAELWSGNPFTGGSVVDTGFASALYSAVVTDRTTNWSFTTTPLDGALTAPPGGTMMWGYNITNPDPLNWLVVSGLSSDVFLHGNPDASVFDLPMVAPSSTLTGNLYQFTWDPIAPMDGINSGIFTLTANWYDGEFNYLDGAPNRSAYYTASVAPVPEPSAWLLVGVGLAGLVLCRRRMAHIQPQSLSNYSPAKPGPLRLLPP